MSTPALARATEAQRAHDADRMECLDHDGYCCPAGDAHDMDGARAADAHQAHATVAAGLHDPDDPDWLARVHDEHRRISPAHMDTSLCSCGERFPTQWRWYQHVARAVRSAILGGA